MSSIRNIIVHTVLSDQLENITIFIKLNHIRNAKNKLRKAQWIQ